MINQILGIILFLMISIMLIITTIDYKKKRPLTKKPRITFIVPCYNDGDSIESTIKNVYKSYKDFQLIVVNDKSTDNSLEVIKRLQEKYDFQFFNNKKNLGKARTLNKVSKLAESELIFFLDADIIITEDNVKEILSRFENNNNLSAVSCPFRSKTKGFLPLMQTIEYNMLSMIQFSSNIFSTLSLWGGFLIIRKSAFEKVGKFDYTAITEDMDLACKLNKYGYKVEQCWSFVETNPPEKFKDWWKQKIRWTSGGMQCFMKYFKVYLKNPLYISFFVLYWSFLTLSMIGLLYSIIFFFDISKICYALYNNGFSLWNILKFINISYGLDILKGLLIKLSFLIFSLPYVIFLIERPRQVYKILYLIPFNFIYLPFFTIVTIVGFYTAIKRNKNLKNGERAW